MEKQGLEAKYMMNWSGFGFGFGGRNWGLEAVGMDAEVEAVAAVARQMGIGSDEGARTWR